MNHPMGASLHRAYPDLPRHLSPDAPYVFGRVAHAAGTMCAFTGTNMYRWMRPGPGGCLCQVGVLRGSLFAVRTNPMVVTITICVVLLHAFSVLP